MTSGHQYKGAWDALRNIGRREGLMVPWPPPPPTLLDPWPLASSLAPHHAAARPQAYYRGNGANVARLFPDVVLKFALHDHIKLVFTPPEVAAPRLRDRLATAATAG